VIGDEVGPKTPGLQIGARIGPFDNRIDEEFIRAYAEATRDDNPLYSKGKAVPPLAIAARIFEGQLAGVESLLPAEVARSAIGGVHGEHDVLLHRAIVPGEELATFVEAYSARPFKNNVRIVFRHLTLDQREEPVAEQLWTTVFFAASCESAGPDSPDHSFPEEARRHPSERHVVATDGEMARRYAEVSRDFSAHHFDLEAARRSGFDSLFLHGLCTMALCTQAVVRTVAGGDPRRLRRVAVRFTSPAFLDNDLVIQLYEAGTNVYPFEAHCAGAKAISNGRAELR
jgi:acyl dehydratase